MDLVVLILFPLSPFHTYYINSSVHLLHRSLSNVTLVGEEPFDTVAIVPTMEAPYIPYDILVNIFKRLEVKSIIRFQSVCKYWKDLIKSPSFIQDHLRHTITHRSPLLLISGTYRIDLRVGLIDLEHKPALEIQKPPLMGSSYLIVGSCNGLVCVYVDDDLVLSFSHNPKKNGTVPPHFLLWNPATRQFREVTVTTTDLSDKYCLGFGFTPIDNDYKIVKIHVGSTSFLVNPVEVYSLNSMSWKEIEFENLEAASISRRWGHVVVNGVMYWLSGNEKDVVSIDLTRQVCTSRPLPHLTHRLIKSLDVYENKLALVACNGLDLIHLWVMDEDTWILTKARISSQYAVKTAPPLVTTIWRNNIVFHSPYLNGNALRRFCLLDVTTGHLQIKVVTEHCLSRIDRINNYVESLVSVGNINDE